MGTNEPAEESFGAQIRKLRWPTVVYLVFSVVGIGRALYSRSFFGWLGSVIANALALVDPPQSWHFSAGVELLQIVANPASYIGVWIGYACVRRWHGIFLSMIPAAALLFFAFIIGFTPLMFFSSAIVHYILITSFPYLLAGSVVGWLLRTRMDRRPASGLPCVIAFLCAAQWICPPTGSAYGIPGHKNVVERGEVVINRDYPDGYLEIRRFLNSLRFGVEDEDFGLRPTGHFYNPFTSRSNKGLNSEGVPQQISAVNVAFPLWAEAAQAYRDGQKADAYYKLGRVTHLIAQDMFQPAHVHDDPHTFHIVGGDGEKIESRFDNNLSLATALGVTTFSPLHGPLTETKVIAFGDAVAKIAYADSIFAGTLTIPAPGSLPSDTPVGLINLPGGNLVIKYFQADPFSIDPDKNIDNLRIPGIDDDLFYDSRYRGDIGLLSFGRDQDWWEIPDDEKAHGVLAGKRFYIDKMDQVLAGGDVLHDYYIKRLVPQAIGHTAGLFRIAAQAFDAVKPTIELRQNDAQGSIIPLDGTGAGGGTIYLKAKDPGASDPGGDPNYPTPSGIYKIALKNLDTGADVAVTPALPAAGENPAERTLSGLAEGRYELKVLDGLGNDTSVNFIRKRPPILDERA